MVGYILSLVVMLGLGWVIADLEQRLKKVESQLRELDR